MEWIEGAVLSEHPGRAGACGAPALTWLALAVVLALALGLGACGGYGGGAGGGQGLRPPALNAVAPATCPVGGGAPVTLTGAGFQPGATVTFGGVPGAVEAVTSSSTAIVTCPVHGPGAVEITLTNPDARAATLPSDFTYLAGPALATVTLASGSIGGSEQVDLGGSGFDVFPAPMVTFGGLPALVASPSTATSMTVITPGHGPGAVDVTVTNADGQSSTLVGGYTYRRPEAGDPTVLSVTNDATGLPSGSVAGGELVTIAGTGFVPGATVLFGGAAASGVGFVSSTTLTALTPLAQPPGTVHVTVALPGTGLEGTALRAFTFLDAYPQVEGFSTHGAPPAGGGPLRLLGSNLRATSTVTFGGVPATVSGFVPGSVAGLDELTVVVPPSPLLPGVTDGFVSVVLRNPDGQASTLPVPHAADGTPWPGNFHYGPPPVITAFGPAGGVGLDVTLQGASFSADAAGVRSGLVVFITGPGFAALRKRICPAAADPACPAGVTSPTPTSLLAEVPAGLLPPGRYAFVVRGFDGQEASSAADFLVP